MIKSIGLTRFLVVAILIGFIAACLFYTYNIVTPGLQKEKRSLATVNGEMSKMTSDISELSQGLDQFKEQQKEFSEVQKFGFFHEQNRVEVTQLIESLQEESRLLSATYSISPAKVVGEKRATEAGYDLLNTDISFDIEAIEDADVYKFIYLLSYGFPGQINIKSLNISRLEEITQPLLRQIGTGQAEAIIKADIKVSWQSMVPQGRLPQGVAGRI